MDSGASVMLYQPDYEKLKKMADENHISLAEVISQLITAYEQVTAGPQVVHMNFGGDPNVVFNEGNC